MESADRKEFLNGQPKKRSASGVLIFNTVGELLIVKPNYKDYWILPGGMSEAYESPKETCEREVKEEINLDLQVDRLLCVDYIRNKRLEDENLLFFFLKTGVSQSEIEKIKLQNEELEAYQFVTKEKALELIGGGTRKRLPKCFTAMADNTVCYLEQGEEVL